MADSPCKAKTPALRAHNVGRFDEMWRSDTNVEWACGASLRFHFEIPMAGHRRLRVRASTERVPGAVLRMRAGHLCIAARSMLELEGFRMRSPFWWWVEDARSGRMLTRTARSRKIEKARGW